MAERMGSRISGIAVHENAIARPGYALLNAVTVYAGNPSRPGYGNLLQFVNLFGKSDSGEGVLYRVSRDNGKTWREIDVFDLPYRVGHGRDMMRKIAGDCMYDEDSRALIRIVTEMLWENGEIHSLFRKRRMYYCLSFDNGATWTDAIYMHQNEEGYDRDRMFPGITYGVNMVTSLFKMHKIRGDGPNKGKLAVGIQVQIVGADGDIYNPTGMGFFKSGCLLGSWNEEKLQYDWEACDTYAEVTPEESTRGVYEPVIQELDDGTLIMVLRGSNMKRPDIPGTKFISVSRDQGRAWSRPVRLTYEDGRPMYSSSSSPDLVQDKQGRIYFVGIITDGNPNGNMPRYPLCIADLNKDTLSIVRDSVTVIDSRRPWHTAQREVEAARYDVDYSNHHAYLDVAESKIVVHAPYRADLHSIESVINRYELQLLD
ncbi:MAG: hypothetical protein K0Q94_3202 [Paenibacillus sp.]|uniref:sialidase family protein n=1 Tax=Paenibacillus sp. GCM10012303 TaxID=3317340 RepID=UPI0029F38E3A|nr:hypothetical protein [Paenibacillus sp.]